MNKTVKYIVIIATVLAILMAMPLILKGAAISLATLMVALILAGIFLLGVCVALAITSPLWIPFVAGWAVVRFYKKYYKKEPPVVSETK